MNRNDKVTEAKDLVLFHGAYSVLEFGEELFWRSHQRDEWTEADVEAVLVEANNQAHRVLKFMGR